MSEAGVARCRRLLAPLLAVLVAGGCVSTGTTPGFTLFSVSQEIEMGRQFAREIEQQHRLVRDPVVDGYINDLGMRLVRAMRVREFPFTFHVVDGPEVNAFAVPGGHIYVYAGLIRRTATEAELASVVAHEIGHVALRHSSQQISAQYGYSLVASLLLGSNPQGFSVLAANAFGTAGLLAYSRAHESEADQFGLRALYQSGYDVHGMTAFFESLLALKEREPSLLERFFASHPPTQDRLRRVRETIAAWPPQATVLAERPEYGDVKERLAGRGFRR